MLFGGGMHCMLIYRLHCFLNISLFLPTCVMPEKELSLMNHLLSEFRPEWAECLNHFYCPLCRLYAVCIVCLFLIQYSMVHLLLFFFFFWSKSSSQMALKWRCTDTNAHCWFSGRVVVLTSYLNKFSLLFWCGIAFCLSFSTCMTLRQGAQVMGQHCVDRLV